LRQCVLRGACQRLAAFLLPRGFPSRQRVADGGQAGIKLRGRPQGCGQSLCVAARLAAERRPPGLSRACVLMGQQAFGFGHERFVCRSRLGQQGAQLVPLPARSHRTGEALSQAGGLRAVPNQWRE
jgi:hypothetical protein